MRMVDEDREEAEEEDKLGDDEALGGKVHLERRKVEGGWECKIKMKRRLRRNNDRRWRKGKRVK